MLAAEKQCCVAAVSLIINVGFFFSLTVNAQEDLHDSVEAAILNYRDMGRLLKRPYSVSSRIEGSNFGLQDSRDDSEFVIEFTIACDEKRFLKRVISRARAHDSEIQGNPGEYFDALYRKDGCWFAMNDRMPEFSSDERQIKALTSRSMIFSPLSIPLLHFNEIHQRKDTEFFTPPWFSSVNAESVKHFKGDIVAKFDDKSPLGHFRVVTFGHKVNFLPTRVVMGVDRKDSPNDVWQDCSITWARLKVGDEREVFVPSEWRYSWWQGGTKNSTQLTDFYGKFEWSFDSTLVSKLFDVESQKKLSQEHVDRVKKFGES